MSIPMAAFRFLFLAKASRSLEGVATDPRSKDSFPMRYTGGSPGLRRNDRARQRGAASCRRGPAPLEGHGAQGPPRDGPRAAGAPRDLQTHRHLRPRRGREQRPPLPSRDRGTRRAGRSAAREARGPAARARRPNLRGPIDHRHGGAARDGRAPVHPRAGPRASRDLQQGRGDDPAARDQQGERPGARARGAGAVTAPTSSPRATRRTITHSWTRPSIRSRSPMRSPR